LVLFRKKRKFGTFREKKGLTPSDEHSGRKGIPAEGGESEH